MLFHIFELIFWIPPFILNLKSNSTKYDVIRLLWNCIWWIFNANGFFGFYAMASCLIGRLCIDLGYFLILIWICIGVIHLVLLGVTIYNGYKLYSECRCKRCNNKFKSYIHLDTHMTLNKCKTNSYF
jgi:hypothetical protein